MVEQKAKRRKPYYAWGGVKNTAFPPNAPMPLRVRRAMERMFRDFEAARKEKGDETMAPCWAPALDGLHPSRHRPETGRPA
jgi:hypothetical protein